MKLLGIMVDIDTTGQLLIIYSALMKYLRENTNTCIEALHQLFIYFKIAYNSVRRKVFFNNIVIEFGIPLKW
jgi:hypothetical protein